MVTGQALLGHIFGQERGPCSGGYHGKRLHREAAGRRVGVQAGEGRSRDPCSR